MLHSPEAEKLRLRKGGIAGGAGQIGAGRTAKGIPASSQFTAM
jgi:hypothetical protein